MILFVFIIWLVIFAMLRTQKIKDMHERVLHIIDRLGI